MSGKAGIWCPSCLIRRLIRVSAPSINGGDVASAYSYTVDKPWGQYNVEQLASIVEHWFMPANLWFKNGPCGVGMKTTDSRSLYIRDNIRKNKAN